MRSVELGSLAEVSGGWTTAAANEGEIRLVRTSDIPSGEVNWDSVPYCEVDPGAERLLLRHGDLLVARTGVGSVGNVAMVTDPPSAVAASYLLRVRVADDVDPEFLLWYLRTSTGRTQLADRAVGSVIPNLSAKRLLTVSIPLVELREQLEIASAVGQAASTHRAGQASLIRAKKRINVVRTSLWEIVLVSLGLDQGAWPRRPLGTLSNVRDGSRVPLNAAQRAAQPGTTPYFGASGVIDHVEGFTHDGEFLLVSEDGQNLESRKRDIALVAHERLWANNHIHVLELNSEVEKFCSASYRGRGLGSKAGEKILKIAEIGRASCRERV